MVVIFVHFTTIVKSITSPQSVIFLSPARFMDQLGENVEDVVPARDATER